MTPIERYQQLLDSGEFQTDVSQKVAVEALQRVFDELVRPAPKKGWASRWLKRSAQNQVVGLYMWGGVGRGKTWLMDLFYDALPGARKMRMHFHRFMRRVHADLTALDGVVNPLDTIADRIATETDIICFDEFFVTDITDAMLLGGLFEALFNRGVALVATSNIEPSRLYENGLQRSRFLPAIKQVEQHCEVLNVDGGTDYRLRTLKQAKLFYYPHDGDTEAALIDSFNHLAGHCSWSENVDIEVERRIIIAKRVCSDVAWFDFSALCDGPRSQHDYIELARQFQAVIISDMPSLNSQIEDQARRFIYLVDEFYDSRVKLIISAAVSLEHLYQGEHLQFEFQRTLSRLLEMQSEDYLASAHSPG